LVLQKCCKQENHFSKKFIEKMAHTMQQMWHPSVAMMTLTLPLTMPKMAWVTHHSRSEANRVTAVAWGSNKTQVTPAKMSAKMYKKCDRDVTDKEWHVIKRTKLCPGMVLKCVANNAPTNPRENEKNAGGRETCSVCGTPTHWYCILCHNWYCVDVLDQLQLQQNNHMMSASKAEIKRIRKEILDWLVSIQYSDGTIIRLLAGT
jgi:hypothetical protein